MRSDAAGAKEIPLGHWLVATVFAVDALGSLDAGLSVGAVRPGWARHAVVAFYMAGAAIGLVVAIGISSKSRWTRWWFCVWWLCLVGAFWTVLYRYYGLEVSLFGLSSAAPLTWPGFFYKYVISPARSGILPMLPVLLAVLLVGVWGLRTASMGRLPGVGRAPSLVAMVGSLLALAITVVLSAGSGRYASAGALPATIGLLSLYVLLVPMSIAALGRRPGNSDLPRGELFYLIFGCAVFWLFFGGILRWPETLASRAFIWLLPWSLATLSYTTSIVHGYAAIRRRTVGKALVSALACAASLLALGVCWGAVLFSLPGG